MWLGGGFIGSCFDLPKSMLSGCLPAPCGAEADIDGEIEWCVSGLGRCDEAIATWSRRRWWESDRTRYSLPIDVNIRY